MAARAWVRTNLWTLPRVARVIKQLTGVQYHPGMWALAGGDGLDVATAGQAR